MTPQEAKKARLLEKYRLMRLEAFLRAQERKKKSNEQTIKRVVKIEMSSRKRMRRPKKEIEIVDFQKRQKEIDQNLTYYCIKYESRYADESDCLRYANQELIDCEVRAIHNYSIDVIRCLKKKLRLR